MPVDLRKVLGPSCRCAGTAGTAEPAVQRPTSQDLPAEEIFKAIAKAATLLSEGGRGEKEDNRWSEMQC